MSFGSGLLAKRVEGLLLPTGLSDAYYSSVVLLAHFNGPDGSQTFTDNSPIARSIVALDTVALAAGKGRFGAALSGDPVSAQKTARVDGTLASWAFPGAYTIEFFYKATGTETGTLLSCYTAAVGGGWKLSINGGFGAATVQFGTKFSNRLTAPTVNISDGNQHHVVVQNNGDGTFSTYYDGVRVSNGDADGGALGNPDVALYVLSDRDVQAWIPHYISELRITKGVARYSGATCRVPTKPFPNK